MCKCQLIDIFIWYCHMVIVLNKPCSFLLGFAFWVLGAYKLECWWAPLSFAFHTVAKLLCFWLCFCDAIVELHVTNENLFNSFLIVKWKCISNVIMHDFFNSCICSEGIYHIQLKSLELIFRFIHKLWPILITSIMYTRSQTTQIWWLANME